MANIERDLLQRPVAEQAYLHTAQAGVVVPLVQSGITGALMGTLALIVALKFRLEDAWFYGLMVLILAWIAAWLVLQRHWFSLTALETYTGLDFNGDGQVGAPDPAQGGAKTVQVNIREVTDVGHLKVTVARFPIDEHRMKELAQGLLDGTPFGERYWCGNGKLLSQDEFRGVRTEMLKRGMLEQANPKSPKQGFKLTRAGRAAMRELSGTHEAPSPTPPD